MLRSKILWAFVLGVVTSVLVFEGKMNLGYSPLWSRTIEVLASAGTHFAGAIFPSGVPEGGWGKFWGALAIGCNFLVYVFFWYACIWITSYFLERRHPYDRQNTLLSR